MCTATVAVYSYYQNTIHFISGTSDGCRGPAQWANQT